MDHVIEIDIYCGYCDLLQGEVVGNLQLEAQIVYFGFS